MFLFLGIGGGAVNLRSYYSDAEGPGDCGSGVFIPEEADGIGDKGLGINISIDAETPLVPFMENLQTWRLYLSSRSIRILGVSALRLKELYCKWRF